MSEATERLRAKASELLDITNAIEAEVERGATLFYIDRASSYSEQPCPEAVPCGGSLWEIALTGLDDLCALVEREGEILIAPPENPSLRGHDRPRLTIYDDHLEPLVP